MNLTFKDLENKDIIVIPEEHLKSFKEKVLKNGADELGKILGREPRIKDIQNFLLANILEFSKNINCLKNLLFSCEQEIEDGTSLWNLIIDNDVIILDTYFIDVKDEKLVSYFNYSIHILDEGNFEVSIDIPEDLEKQKDFDIDTLNTVAALRLLYYIVALSEGDIK